MSEILIALLLIVPVLLVIAILSRSHKKEKKRQMDKLSAYLFEVTDGFGSKIDFQKHLVHQFIVIDETSRKLLIVDHHENLSHECLSLEYMRSAKVVILKDTIRADDQSKKTETITKQIGVELVFERPEKEIVLVVYDHIEHNIFQMADLEKEAGELCKIITIAKTRQLAV
jgi:hypothetical protein